MADVKDWHGCYDDNWNDVIVSEAFAHPAKFARGLVERIVRHGLAQGYWKPVKRCIEELERREDADAQP